MGLFRSKQPENYVPSDAEVQHAADQLNAGNQKPADKLCDRAGDYQQDTAFRILGAAALPADED